MSEGPTPLSAPDCRRRVDGRSSLLHARPLLPLVVRGRVGRRDSVKTASRIPWGPSWLRRELTTQRSRCYTTQPPADCLAPKDADHRAASGSANGGKSLNPREAVRSVSMA